ncbi:hypothetical protein BGY98DRAFT_1061125, partial [Russula aff. rugulosa BPL654]
NLGGLNLTLTTIRSGCVLPCLSPAHVWSNSDTCCGQPCTRLSQPGHFRQLISTQYALAPCYLGERIHLPTKNPRIK